MRLTLLVTLTMIAFAANSVLNRMAVAEFSMDPLPFAVVRVAAGAFVLVAIVMLRKRRGAWSGLGRRWGGAVALATYMLGFSYAYQTLGAGLGALILFGSLQLMLFGWAVRTGQRVARAKWLGMAVALVGLVVLLWPSKAASVPLGGTLAMLVATAGWASYTVQGQAAADALARSAENFVLCLPLVALPLLAQTGSFGGWGGLACAIVAGGVTSGLGYALWYRVLPKLAVTQAALAQLSVPVIAVLGGAALLSEPITARMLMAATLVLGGIAVSIAPTVRADHS